MFCSRQFVENLTWITGNVVITGLHESVFLEKEFFLLVIFSLLFPALIYGTMWLRRAISRSTVLVFGFVLIILSGMDIYLLQILSSMAKHSPSMLDDKIFSSAISIALYLMPALFAGTGINLVSHILISHLAEAESRFEKKHSKPDI
ncbi:MAG: hypothetical protein ABI144_00755 [Gallionella sp.]